MKRTRDEELCQCMKPAVKKTVTKESDNKGRTFWSCRSRGCAFFQWTTDLPKNWFQEAQEKKRAKKPGCQCKQGPRRVETKKAGANKGRWFLSCESCNFFQWDSPVVVLAAADTPETPWTLPVPDYTITIPDGWDFNIN